ncbi:MAG: HD domain-containing protein [Rikenellaceae bacterium]
MIRAELVTYIEQSVIPRYADFDRAHNLDHVQTVIAESAALATHYPELDEEMVYVIAAFHDTGLCEGRERHHIVSGEIVRADSFIATLFSALQIEIIAEAIEDHRASSKSDPRSLYGCVVAEADRVISTYTTLRRTVQYGLRQNPEATIDEHFSRFEDHLQTKYAEGGYLKLYIPFSDNAARLEQLRAVVGNRVELRARFNEIFAQEVAKGL